MIESLIKQMSDSNEAEMTEKPNISTRLIRSEDSTLIKFSFFISWVILNKPFSLSWLASESVQ